MTTSQSANPGSGAHAAAVRLCPGGALPVEAGFELAAAALAEVTHAPTGFGSYDPHGVHYAPGHPGAVFRYGGSPALLVVLTGRLAVDFGTALDQTIVATAGDSLLIGAGERHRERPGGDEAVTFLRLSPSGPPLPA
jgi:mannose-6-phosphate isomerase-like protein (cupin superfamily)